MIQLSMHSLGVLHQIFGMLIHALPVYITSHQCFMRDIPGCSPWNCFNICFCKVSGISTRSPYIKQITFLQHRTIFNSFVFPFLPLLRYSLLFIILSSFWDTLLISSFVIALILFHIFYYFVSFYQGKDSKLPHLEINLDRLSACRISV